MPRFAILLLGLSVACHADTTIKKHIVTTDSKPPANVEARSEIKEILYKKGYLRKKENTTASLADIVNCDSRTGLLVDFKVHEYKTYKIVKFTPSAQIEQYIEKNPQNAVNIESTTVETGELKLFFGRPAKHFITTTKRPPDKNDAGGEETVDAWYIDHEPPDNNCAPEYVRSEPYYVVGTALVMFPQVARLHHTGPLPMGLAVRTTATHRILGANGVPDRTITTIETVEELSDAPINPSLFELPTGLHQKDAH